MPMVRPMSRRAFARRCSWSLAETPISRTPGERTRGNLVRTAGNHWQPKKLLKNLRFCCADLRTLYYGFVPKGIPWLLSLCAAKNRAYLTLNGGWPHAQHIAY